MNYSKNINSDFTAKVELCSDLYYSKDFTLTVNTVNDAPIVLHPLEELISYRGCSSQLYGAESRIIS